jgi:uncharacterized protein YprB with RNaseH-like and TPR domain
MRDLRDKLRRRIAVDPAEAGIGALLRARWLRRRDLAPARLPDGEIATNRRGDCYVRRLRLPRSERHGAVGLDMADRFDRERLAGLAGDERWRSLAPGDCLFLDTETTGLAGGAGTLVFLAGMAWIEPAQLVVEQVFLREYGDEPALLQQVADRLAERPVPVTFVGKSFDRHRLAARMTVHRVPSGVLTDRHLDLYHLARRAHRGRLPDFRLRTIEQHLLRVTRQDDLPGAEAPAAFLAWMRDRSGPIDRVFEHNRLDLLSLVALLATL